MWLAPASLPASTCGPKVTGSRPALARFGSLNPASYDPFPREAEILGGSG